MYHLCCDVVENSSHKHPCNRQNLACCASIARSRITLSGKFVWATHGRESANHFSESRVPGDRSLPVLCGAAEKHELLPTVPERGSYFRRVKFFRQHCISLPFEQRVLRRCAIWRWSKIFSSIGIRYHFAWGQIFSSALVLDQYGISGGQVSTVHF
eukprot:COSAG02_NODE_7757_length_2861_cov_1.433382_3_plen_156_part_00